MFDAALNIGDALAGIALVPGAVELLGGGASWTTRLPARSSGSASPRFSRHSWIKAASSLSMMIRASEPPMEERRSNGVGPNFGTLMDLFDMATSRTVGVMHQAACVTVQI